MDACGDKQMFQYIEGLLQDDDIDELDDGENVVNETGEVATVTNDEQVADGNDEDSDCSLFVDISASHSGTSVNSAEIGVTPDTELLQSSAQSVGTYPDLPEFSEQSEVSHNTTSGIANLCNSTINSPPHESNSQTVISDDSGTKTIENNSEQDHNGGKNQLVIPATVERLHADQTPCGSPASRASDSSSVLGDHEDSESTALANTPSTASATRSAGDLTMVCGSDSSETDSAEEDCGKKDDPSDPTWMRGISPANGSPLSKLQTSLGQRVARKRKRLAMRGGRGLQHLTSNMSEKEKLAALAARATVKPEWLRPFDFGWKREIVMRNVDDSPRHLSAPPRCDIYYYSPENVKLRSAPEIADYLIKTSSGVGIESFTFSKFPIHREPFEIVRAASRCPTRRSAGSSRNVSPVKSSSGLVISKRSPDSKRLVFKIKQTAVNGEKRARLDDDGTMHVDLMQLEKPSRFRFAKKRPTPVMRTGFLGPMHRAPAPRLAPAINGNIVASIPSGPSSRVICGLSCPGLNGIPPSLNCTRCMCLFHPSCIGGPQSSDSFVCQWCRAACQKSNPLPLSVTRLNVLGTIRGPPRLTPAPNVINPGLPRLQRAATSTAPSILPALSGPLAPPALRMFAQQPAVRTTTVASPVIVVQPPSLGTFIPAVSVISPPGTSYSTTVPPPPLIMRSVFPNTTVLSSANVLPITVPSRPAPLLINATGTRPQAVLGSVAPVRTWLLTPSQVPSATGGVRHILKLPSNISSQLNLRRPVGLRINDQRLLLQPSNFVVTPTGVSVILPSETVEKSTARPDLNSARFAVNRARRMAAPSQEIIDVDADPAVIDLNQEPDKPENPSNSIDISLPTTVVPSTVTSETSVINISPSPLPSSDELTPAVVSPSSASDTASIPAPAVSISTVTEGANPSIPLVVNEIGAITSQSIDSNESTSQPSPCSESAVTPVIAESAVTTMVVESTVTPMIVDSCVSISVATSAAFPVPPAENSCSLIAESRNDNCSTTENTSGVIPGIPSLSGDTTVLPSTSQSPPPEENVIVMPEDSCGSSAAAITTISPPAEAPGVSPAGVTKLSSGSDAISDAVTETVPSPGAISPSNHISIEPVVLPTEHHISVEPQEVISAIPAGTVEQISHRTRKRRISTSHFQKLNTGVDTLLRIFRYLPVLDLLRASQVCRTWRIMATHPCLWSSVTLRGVRVTDWDLAAQHLTRVSTEQLDLRGCSMDGTSNYLSSVFGKLITVRQLDLGSCSFAIVNLAAERMLQLHQLSAESILSFSSMKPLVDLRKFQKQTQLRTLRLRSVGGLNVVDPSNLFSRLPSCFRSLQTLSITTMESVPICLLKSLEQLTSLRVLELGDCYSLSKQMFADLGKLVNLTILRLESGGQCPDEGLYMALLEMKCLEQLELIRYTVDSILAAVLSSLPVRVLSLWPEQPDNESQAALLNTCIMTSVCRMSCLRQFDWGIISDQSTGAVAVPLLPTLADNSAVTTVSSAIKTTTINGLVATLSNKLPHTKIRVFRVPVVSHSTRR